VQAPRTAADALLDEHLEDRRPRERAKRILQSRAPRGAGVRRGQVLGWRQDLERAASSRQLLGLVGDGADGRPEVADPWRLGRIEDLRQPVGRAISGSEGLDPGVGVACKARRICLLGSASIASPDLDEGCAADAPAAA
jgi:hypothetical protein